MSLSYTHNITSHFGTGTEVITQNNLENLIMSTSRNTSGFVKADSTNLPEVNNVMILEFMAVSSNHNVAEIRGAKTLLSSRDSYLSSAVGYVEISRTIGYCTVKARVVPEHRIGNKMYSVTVKVNENEGVIEDSSCEDCAAAAGRCKHSLLFLFWLAKKSEEPSPTSVKCYWSKPSLSSARTEHLKCKNTFKSAKKIKLAPKDPSVLADFLKECKDQSITESLITSITGIDERESFNIFDMSIEFVQNSQQYSFEDFKNYMDQKITEDVKRNVSQKTINQANDKYWHYVRQGRITASKLHDAACCDTDGTLVQQILGGYKVPETAAIKRGRKLEEEVKKEIEKKINMKLNYTGFILIDSIFGASPDGLTNDFVVEIKCPMTKKAMQNYIKNNAIQNKFKTQINSQMLASGKQKGLFCVADPSFEESKEIHMYWVNYDETYLKGVMENALNFWKKYVYPKLLASAK